LAPEPLPRGGIVLVLAPATGRRVRLGRWNASGFELDNGSCAGQRIVLKNDSPNNNIDFDTTGVVMAFQVAGGATEITNNTIPPVLNPGSPVMALDESDAKTSRRMALVRKHGPWTINGETWEDVINSDFKLIAANPALGGVEIWELENRSGGWFHPVHIHLVDFRILDRNGQPSFAHERGPRMSHA